MFYNMFTILKSMFYNMFTMFLVKPSSKIKTNRIFIQLNPDVSKIKIFVYSIYLFVQYTQNILCFIIQPLPNQTNRSKSI